MKFWSFLLVILTALISVMLMGLPAAAQDIELNETFTFDSGTTFSYPEGGEVTVNPGFPNFMSVAFDDALVYVADFAMFEARDFSADSELIDAAQWYVETISSAEFDPDAVEASEIDGHEALQYPYIYEDEAWLLLLVRMEDDTFVAFDSGGADEDTLLALAASLIRTEIPTCTVSAETEGTVQLRVGPGENRTSFAFLPAKIEYTPLGQTVANDGSLWFQLDKADVAPQSAAAEAWVAAEAVETSGNCDTIGEASAPPIVPIIPAAPSTSSGSGDSGSGDAGNNSGGSIAPAPGTWTISYGSRGKGSCLDNAGFTYEFDVDWGTDVVSLSFSGATMILDGNRFNQIQPGVFSGLFSLANGNSFQLFLRPVSSTHLTGEAMLTGVVEGHTCSNTVPVTVTKN